MTHRLHLTAPGLTRILTRVMAVLLFCHLVMVFCHLYLHRKVEAFSMLFDMDLEGNLPTFFNSFLFFLCAALAYVMGRGQEGVLRRGWYVIAGVFVFLGIDEGSQIHEKFLLVTFRLINRGSSATGLVSWLYYAWVIPYCGAAVLLVAILGRWLVQLAAPVRNKLFMTGGLYVLGAVVLESISGKVALGLSGAMTPDQLNWIPCEIYDEGSCHLYLEPVYLIIYTLEEICEMAALIFTAHVLVRALEQRKDMVEVRMGAA